MSTERIDALCEILNDLFAVRSGTKVEILAKERGLDINLPVVSQSGAIYLHPPLYYAIIAGNVKAIRQLKSLGATYQHLSAEEVQQIKQKIHQEQSYSSAQHNQMLRDLSNDSQIAIHLPSAIYGIQSSTAQSHAKERFDKIMGLLEKENNLLKQPKQAVSKNLRKSTQHYNTRSC
jgi:hypothetical protein